MQVGAKWKDSAWDSLEEVGIGCYSIEKVCVLAVSTEKRNACLQEWLCVCDSDKKVCKSPNVSEGWEQVSEIQGRRKSSLGIEKLECWSAAVGAMALVRYETPIANSKETFFRQCSEAADA